MLKPVLRGLQERPRAIPTLFFRLQEAPRALQEASKRLPRGILRPSASKIRFGAHSEPILSSTKETLGPYKSSKSFVLCSSFVVLPFSARIAFGPRFGTYFTHFFHDFRNAFGLISGRVAGSPLAALWIISYKKQYFLLKNMKNPNL